MFRGNFRHTVNIHFEYPWLSSYLNTPNPENKDSLPGCHAKLHCSDKKFGEKNAPLVAEIINAMNEDLKDVGVKITSHVISSHNGVTFALCFEKSFMNLKIPAPNYTWQSQLVETTFDRFADFGYEFLSEARNEIQSTYQFVEGLICNSHVIKS